MTTYGDDRLVVATLADDIESAALSGQLVLAYQPVVTIADGRLCGFEALVRWRHPELGLLGPDSFVPVVERSGRIATVGTWVLSEACRQLGAWRRRCPGNPVWMSVNLSGEELRDPDLLDRIDETLAIHRVPAASLCLEITESWVVQERPEVATALAALRARGVRVAVDDFGTGYSSLSQLRRFPVDHLKIDQSFVAGLGSDVTDTAIVELVLQLANRLGLTVVAEGIETADQARRLRQLGCPLGQGFLWSRPLAAAAAERLFAAECGQTEPTITPHPGAAELDWTPQSAGAAEDPDVPGRDTAETARDEVLAVLAHELRTPLHTIASFAELMRSDLDEGRVLSAEPLESILSQTQRIHALVEGLCDVQSIGTGTLRFTREPVDLVSLVEQTSAELAHVLGEHPIEVAVVDAPVVEVDRGRIVQILTNLLVNAAKHSPTAAPIGVAVRRRGDLAEVMVVDRGPGVSPERVGWLFRKYGRLNGSGGGLGLGLFISRGIARAHGGDLVYRRADSGGAEFTLQLPIREPSEDDRHGVSPEASSVDGPRRSTTRIHRFPAA